MKRRNFLIIIAAILVVLITAAFIVMYPFYRFYFSGGSKSIDNNLTIVQGGGGNSGILVTDSAVVVIDTKMGGDAKKLHDSAVRLAGPKKIIVINTHYHPDHTSGNYLYTGCPIYTGAYDKAFLAKELKPENIPTHFVTDSLVLDLGDETVAMYNFGRAHTWNDIVVLLKKRKVLFTGDLVFHKVNPFLAADAGADVPLWMAALDRIIAMPGVDTLVPGHGNPGGMEMAVLLKTYFTDMTIAANDPSKEKEVIAKYKDWFAVPMAMTPEKTISYIRK
jgi:glyoxylase-like metal-dependent hydrolase (beta-lactamase superfamily II)